MKISKKGQYALRMMVDIAEHSSNKWIPLKDISARQDISVKYLEQIVTHLTRSGLLRSGRGAGGGYMLTREPDQYTAGEILRTIEGNLTPVACLDDEPNQCERNSYCKTLNFWHGLQNAINTYVDSVTLQDMMDSNNMNAWNFSI